MSLFKVRVVETENRQVNGREGVWADFVDNSNNNNITEKVSTKTVYVCHNNNDIK